MEKKITMAMLNETIEVACDNLRKNCGFTDEQCLTFAADLMENLAKDGWRIVEGISPPRKFPIDKQSKI